MKDRILIFAISINTVVGLMVVDAIAREPEKCSQLLQPDVAIFKKDHRTQIAYLQTISKANFDEAKANGNISTTVPVDGVPVKANGSYEDYRKSLASYANSIGYKFDKTESIQYYSSRINPKNGDNFVNCMKNQSHGLIAYMSKPADENGEISISIEWIPPSEKSPPPIIIDVDVRENGILSKKMDSITISPNGKYILSIGRKNKEKALKVVLIGKTSQGGDYAEEFNDPGIFPLPTENECRKILGNAMVVIDFQVTQSDPPGASHVGATGQDILKIERRNGFTQGTFSGSFTRSAPHVSEVDGSYSGDTIIFTEKLNGGITYSNSYVGSCSSRTGKATLSRVSPPNYYYNWKIK